MQWDIDGLLVWLITISIYTINLEGAMWKQMLCPELIGVKMIKPSQLQAIVTSAITGQGKDYIDILTCSPRAIESFTLAVHDNAQVVCKSMTMAEIDPDIDRYHCFDQLWNPNCITPSDWLKVQAKDQVIHDLIQQYGTKELHKNRNDDSLEMKQFG